MSRPSAIESVDKGLGPASLVPWPGIDPAGGFSMASRGRALTQVLLAALLMAAALPFAPPARAKTLTVCPSGCDFTTIAAALPETGNGDTIAIGEGTYDGGVVIEKDVTLQGAGRDKTTILGTSASSVIRVGASAHATIRDVTITGGGGSPSRSGTRAGGGILNEGGLVLADSAVRENAVPSGAGGGVYSRSSKTLKILGSLIAGNQAEDGGGILINGDDAEIVDSTITGNRSTRSGGGIRHEGWDTLRLVRCVISDNRSELFDGGVSTSDKLEVVDSTISGNSAPNVGGLRGGRELVKVVRTTISGNNTRGNGGGIRSGSGGVELVNSTVKDNRAGNNGAGLYTAEPSGHVSLRNSTVSGNVAAQDGGGIWNKAAEIALDNSKVIDNRAGRGGGGIYSENPRRGSLKIRNGSAVSGNLPDQCYPVSLRC
jgi:hypothetical protein